MHFYYLFIIYYFQTISKNVAGYEWITTKGSIDQLIAPWINASRLCHSNQSIPVAITSLYGGQVLVMRNDCQSHIIDFHESAVTDIEIPLNSKFSNSCKCFTVLGLLNTYMKREVSQNLEFVLVRLRKNTWEWLTTWIDDDQLFCAVDPENYLIVPHQMQALVTNEEHKLLFDLGNRIFYNCSTNKCSNGENEDSSAADLHSSIPSMVQVFEFGDTTYAIYHSSNDNRKPMLNVRDIRNSTNAFLKPSPGSLYFKLFIVNISTKYTKKAYHHIVGLKHKVVSEERTNSCLCRINCSSSSKLDMPGSKTSNHENRVIPVVIVIIASCIIVALLGTVFIQRSQLAKSRNEHVCCHTTNPTTCRVLLAMPSQAAPNDVKTTVLDETNNVQDPSIQSSSKSIESPHEEPYQRRPILMNHSAVNSHQTDSAINKSYSEVTQSLSTGDLPSGSSTVKSIGEQLKKCTDLKIAPPTPHPDTSNLQSISTNIPTGPRECMNPRAEKTTSNDHDAQSLGQWPIQFMMRVLRDKRRSRKPNI